MCVSVPSAFLVMDFGGRSKEGASSSSSAQSVRLWRGVSEKEG